MARDWHLIPTARIKTKSEAHALIAGISKNFDEARRYAELTQFEFEESPDRERISLGNLETTLSRAEDVFVVASSLGSDQRWDEWQQLTPAAKIAESELRNVAAKRIQSAATNDVAKEADADVSVAFGRWNEAIIRLPQANSRTALVSQIAAEVEQLG